MSFEKDWEMIRYLGQQDIGQQLILDNNEFLTPRNVHNHGIILCSQCGKFLPMEFRYCENCKKNAIFILADEIQNK